jgi:isochorismate synthase
LRFFFRELSLTMQNITIIQDYINRNEPFYAYRIPGESVVYICKAGMISDLSFKVFDTQAIDAGFVIYPFSTNADKGYFIKLEDKIEVSITGDYKENGKPISADETNDGFDDYLMRFNRMMSQLVKGEVQKVILSRVISQNEVITHKISDVFAGLCVKYPEAFVYVVSTPQTGVWMGASPELLFKKENDICKTVALAGTDDAEAENESWTSKEIEEQSFVSNYVDKLFRKHHIETYIKNGPYVAKAGSVVHLKTEYQFKANLLKNNLGAIINDLHPTPAICGEPKHIAMNLIKQTENHNRSYYGGFLGPIDKEIIQLYVNIRCMKVDKNHYSIFVGGGLTPKSVAENEWNETILKSKTLLSVIINNQKY